MKNGNALISQITFNTKTLEWTLYLYIRGNTTRVNVTADEASSIINDIKQGDDNRISIEQDAVFVYYLPINPS